MSARLRPTAAAPRRASPPPPSNRRRRSSFLPGPSHSDAPPPLHSATATPDSSPPHLPLPHSSPLPSLSTVSLGAIPHLAVPPPTPPPPRFAFTADSCRSGAESEGIIAPPLPISRRATAASISAWPPPISRRPPSPGPRRRAQLSLERASSHRSPPPLPISRCAVDAIFTDTGSIEAQPVLTNSVAAADIFTVTDLLPGPSRLAVVGVLVSASWITTTGQISITNLDEWRSKTLEEEVEGAKQAENREARRGTKVLRTTEGEQSLIPAGALAVCSSISSAAQQVNNAGVNFNRGADNFSHGGPIVNRIGDASLSPQSASIHLQVSSTFIHVWTPPS
uniref:Uncharacterized protein n=1 Tax=Oryza punctata TaxID=4537 RepID=A0A0E0KTY3_ORYPU